MTINERQKDEILDLLCEAFGEEYRGYYALQLRIWSEKEPEAFCLIEEDGSVAAYLLAATYYTASESDKYAYLYCVTTRSDLRGKGLMTRLFGTLFEDLAERGFKGAFLVPTDETLVAFYERYGFRRRDTPAFNYPLVDDREYLIPGEAAQIYLEESGEKEDFRGETLLPLAAGWMLREFNAYGILPSSASPVRPLP